MAQASEPGTETLPARVRRLRGERFLVMKRIVGVAGFRPAEERRTVVPVQRQMLAQALRQIRVRDEMPPERDEIRIAGFDDRFGTLTIEAAGRDNRPMKMRAQALRRNGFLIA